MKNLYTVARIMIVGGFVAFVAAIALNILELPIPVLGLIGFASLIIGVLIKAWGDTEAILLTLGGGILALIGIAGFFNELKEGSSGVAVYGGVPVPMLIIFALAALAGLYFFIQGLIRIWQ